MKKYIILYLVFISFFGCRTVKKDYLEETYAKKESLEIFGQKLSKKIETKIEEATFKYNSSKKEQEQQSSKKQVDKEKINQSQTTTVKGRIVAEAGMNKSVSFGGTTITTNGADVEFQTTSNNSKSKESFSLLENKIKDVAKFSSQTFQATKRQHEIMVQQQKTIEILNNEVISLREKYNKLIKKTGFQFLVYPIAAVLILMVLLYKKK